MHLAQRMHAPVTPISLALVRRILGSPVLAQVGQQSILTPHRSHHRTSDRPVLRIESFLHYAFSSPCQFFLLRLGFFPIGGDIVTVERVVEVGFAVRHLEAAERAGLWLFRGTVSGFMCESGVRELSTLWGV